jgi:hypothetical protein
MVFDHHYTLTRDAHFHDKNRVEMHRFVKEYDRRRLEDAWQANSRGHLQQARQQALGRL